MTQQADDLAHLEPFTALDRCDRCGAQAYVRVTIGSSDLLFCGHHFTDNEPKLAAVATYIQDERSELRAAETKAVA